MRLSLRYLVTFSICAAAVLPLRAQIPGATVSWLYVSNSGGHNEPFLTSGPDGNAWFIDETRGVVGKLTVSGTEGTETTYAIAPNLPAGQGVINFARAIAGGPDAVWFIVQSCANQACSTGQFAQLGRITTSGTMTIVPIAGESDFASAMVVGPDGNIWFKEASNQHIVRVTPQGVMTQFKPAAPTCCGSGGIVVGPDQNIWFSEGRSVGRITPSGTITEFPVTFAGALTTGPDGNLWYGTDDNRIGRLTVSGQETLFTVPGALGIGGITTGPDGNLWFTSDGKDIGQLVVSSGTPSVQTCTSCPSSGIAGAIVPVSIPVAGSSLIRPLDNAPAANALFGTFEGLSGPGGLVLITIKPSGSPDLSIKVKGSRVPALFGGADSLQYSITVENVGSAPTTGPFEVKDSMPEGFVPFRAHLPSSCSVDSFSNGLICTIDQVLPPAPSSDRFYSLVVDGDVPGGDGTTLTTQVSVSGGGDTNPGNNVDTDIFTWGKPAVQVTASHSGDRFIGLFEWTDRILTVGNSATSGPLTITDTLPLGVTLQSLGNIAGAVCNASGLVVTCTTNGALVPGQLIQISLRAATVPTTNGISNNVTVSGGGIDPTAAQDIVIDRAAQTVGTPSPQSTGGRH